MLFKRRIASNIAERSSVSYDEAGSSSSTIFESPERKYGRFGVTESESSSDEEFVVPGYERRVKTTRQNRRSWPTLADITDRFQISDRAGAAVANATLYYY